MGPSLWNQSLYKEEEIKDSPYLSPVPCEGSKKLPTVTQEEDPQKELNLLPYNLGLFSLQNSEK